MQVGAVVPGRSGFPVRPLEGHAVVRSPTDFDSFTAPDIAGELCALLDSGARGLIVDMSDMAFCDAASLSALVRTARRARGWGSWVRLVVPNPQSRILVRLVSIDGLMPVHASLAEAMASARG